MADIDVSNDYQFFDNTEAVTLTLKRFAGDTTVSIASALRGRTSRDEPIRSGAALMRDSLSFFLPGDEVTSSNEVEPGDTVTDASANIFTIKSVGRVEMGGSMSGYRCPVTPER